MSHKKNGLHRRCPPAFSAAGSQCRGRARRRSIPGAGPRGRGSIPLRRPALPCSYLLPPRHVCPHVPAATRAPLGSTKAAAAAMPITFGPDLARCHVLQPVRARSSLLGTGTASEQGVGGERRGHPPLRRPAARQAPGLHQCHRGPVSPHPAPDAGFLSPYASFPILLFFFLFI